MIEEATVRQWVRLMARSEFTDTAWRKSSVCNDGESCVEVAHVAGRIGVRNSGDGDSGPILLFDEYEWQAFVAGVQAGDFDSMG